MDWLSFRPGASNRFDRWTESRTQGLDGMGLSQSALLPGRRPGRWSLSGGEAGGRSATMGENSCLAVVVEGDSLVGRVLTNSTEWGLPNPAAPRLKLSRVKCYFFFFRSAFHSVSDLTSLLRSSTLSCSSWILKHSECLNTK